MIAEFGRVCEQGLSRFLETNFLRGSGIQKNLKDAMNFNV